MPDVSTSPPENPETQAPAPPAAWHGLAPRPPRAPRAPRRRAARGWVRWLRVVALVILLPVIALGIGLLIAWIVHEARGNPAVAPPVPSPQPSASAVKTPPPSTAPKRVVVPADWVTESDPPAGVTYRHPPGWIRRTALPEIIRFAPVSPGSTTPGIEGVGAGIEATVSPTQALQQFVVRAYGGEPQLQKGTITAVSGSHSGEQQEIVTYVRAGVPVSVVVHAFASNGHSVVVLGRAASAQAGRAAELEAAVEASLQLTG